MTRRIAFGFLMALCLMGSGCSGSSLLGKDPRCPFTERGGCQSVKAINRMIDENRFSSDGNFIEQKQKPPCCVLTKKKMQVYLPQQDKFVRPIAGYAPDNSAAFAG